jgi:hypothetical protein
MRKKKVMRSAVVSLHISPMRHHKADHGPARFTCQNPLVKFGSGCHAPKRLDLRCYRVDCNRSHGVPGKADRFTTCSSPSHL